jgi:hypothetical protein
MAMVRMMLPKAPRAAASVGVNKPRPILPMTGKVKGSALWEKVA